MQWMHYYYYYHPHLAQESGPPIRSHVGDEPKALGSSRM